MPSILFEYPNFINSQLPHKVGCAREENKENAHKAFQRMCPRLYIVDKVNYEISEYLPYCRWHVEFCREDRSKLPLSEDEVKECFKKLRRFYPTDTSIIREYFYVPNITIIEYGVRCYCPGPLEAYAAVSRRYQDKYITKMKSKRFLRRRHNFC